MKIPKYVVELLNRSKYEFEFFTNHADYATGYTIRIRKSTPYSKANTFAAEIERLKCWVEKNHGEMIVIDVPRETHFAYQTATVTIFDPVMQNIELYISNDHQNCEQRGVSK